jgi:hypothetical protein
MNDEPDKREGKNPKRDPRKDPRQDRLKLALRENLKRRKSQARERGETTARNDDMPPHDENEKKRNE